MRARQLRKLLRAWKGKVDLSMKALVHQGPVKKALEDRATPEIRGDVPSRVVLEFAAD
jgi:hypothetical protein